MSAVLEPLDPRHGMAEPTASTPPRRTDSIRRTSTVDSSHPGGVGTPLRQAGRARDLYTTRAGDAEVVAETTMSVTTEYTDGPILTRIVLDPPSPTTAALVGVRASTGFRKVIDDAVDEPRGSLTYLLLDDIPGATLVSGFALVVAMHRDTPVEATTMSLRSSKQPVLQVPDLCAGWQQGGTMEKSLDEQGRPPVIMGPLALSIEDATDEWAWHPIATMPDDSMRRRRRIDVWRHDDGAIRVDVFFRDSHMAPGGVETAVHEYTVAATVDPDTMVVTRCEAFPHVLPWTECPQAAASAQRLAGMPLASLRPDVRAQFVGPSTCTHLNDVLRGLEDVEWLAQELTARSG
jgi:hypothetical protein